GPNEGSKPPRKWSELSRAQAAQSHDQALLGGLGQPPSEGASSRGERDLNTTGVLFGRPPNHQPPRLEAGQDDGDGALVRECALREIINRWCRCLSELLQDEELCPTDPEPSFRGASRRAQGSDDSAERIHHGDHIGSR